MKNQFIIVETTVQNSSEANKIAELLLKQKIAACIQFIKINSTYFWQGKIENNEEVLLRIKSVKKHFEEIKNSIISHHNYDLPEVILIETNQGSKPYFDWIESNVKNEK